MPKHHFDPEISIVMQSVDFAWEFLKSNGSPYTDGKSEWARETLALRIIDTSQKGERDVIKLREDAWGFLAQAKPPAE